MEIIKIPNDIVFNKELSLNELGLVYVLYGIADENGEIHESIDNISKMSKCSKTSFYKYLNVLKSKDIVTSYQPHESGRFQSTILKLTEVIK